MQRDATQMDLGRILPGQIAFDIDGVIADSFRAFVRMAREDYGLDVSYEAITEYDFLKVLDMDVRIAREIIDRLLDFPLEMGIEPIEGAVDVLTRLSGFGPLLLVTARPRKEGILRWIKGVLPEVPLEAVRIEATGGHGEKLPILQEQGVRYFLEDRMDTCYLLQEVQITPIVFDQPWNRGHHPFERVKTWEEIAAMIAWSREETSLCPPTNSFARSATRPLP